MYYQTQDNSFLLLQGDCSSVMEQLEKRVDVIFADPPYFLSNGGISVSNGKVVCVDKGDWDKGGTPEHIREFNMRWLKACREVLKDDGTIWVSGTLHNIHIVQQCLTELGYKILNVITWQKVDPPPMIKKTRFNFSSEFIIWAAKSPKSKYFLNFDLMERLNDGKQMTDVWRIPAVGMWEKKCGKHPTQKPLHLLYRIILATTREGETILDPFNGSGTTGIAAKLLGRKYIGIDMDAKFLSLTKRRFDEISDANTAKRMLGKMKENPEEVMVLVNHCRDSLRKLMIEKGICYLRAGDSKGSLLVTPGFERLQYVLLHTNGKGAVMFRLKNKGSFQIWQKSTLEEYGFSPSHAPYYVVLQFDNQKPIAPKSALSLRERMNTFTAKIKPLSDIIGIK